MIKNYYSHNDFTTESLHLNYIPLKTNVTECERWEYDTSEFESTFVTQVSMVISTCRSVTFSPSDDIWCQSRGLNRMT